MGLPLFGTSNYSDPQWMPEPNSRGTWGLVQTCLLTLGLCVYTAIHLNVFHRECRWWTRALIRLKWLVVALLAPEFIVYNAWSQRRQAVRIARMLRRRCGQEEPVSLISALWARLRPKAGTSDPERPRRQNRQPDGALVRWRSRSLARGQHLPPLNEDSLAKSEVRAQGGDEKPGGTGSAEVPVKVRSTEKIRSSYCQLGPNKEKGEVTDSAPARNSVSCMVLL